MASLLDALNKDGSSNLSKSAANLINRRTELGLPEEAPSSPFSSSAPAAPAPEAPVQAPSLTEAIKQPVSTSSIDFRKIDSLQNQLSKATDNRQVNSVDDIIQKQTDAAKSAVDNLQKDPNYSGYKTTIDNLQNQIETTRGLMQDKEEQVGWLSAMERIGQALTQYAAASYGLEKGVNLAGLKMDKTDWQRVLENSQNRLQNEIKGLQDLRAESTKKLGGMEEDASQLAKSAVGENLRQEERKQQAKEAGLEKQIETERFKLTQQLAQDNKEAMLQLKQDLSKSKAGNKSLDDTKRSALDVVTGDAKLAQQELKALKQAAANTSLIEDAKNAKSEDEASKRLTIALSAAGLAPENAKEEVSTWLGLSSNKEFTPEKVTEVINKAIEARQAIIKSSYDWSKKIHEAGSPEALDSIMNQKLGGISAPTLAAPAPESGMIKVRLKSSGQTGSVPAAEFDPALYEKI